MQAREAFYRSQRKIEFKLTPAAMLLNWKWLLIKFRAADFESSMTGRANIQFARDHNKL